MIVSEIKLYELLKAKLGEKEAEAFVEILEKKVDHKFEDAKQLLASKEDLVNTKVDLIKWMVGFWIAQMVANIGLYLNK